MVVPPLRPVFSIDKEGEGKCMHRQKLVIRCQMRRWTTSLPMPSTYFELVMRAFGGAPGIDTVLREGTGVTVGGAGGRDHARAAARAGPERQPALRPRLGAEARPSLRAEHARPGRIRGRERADAGRRPRGGRALRTRAIAVFPVRLEPGRATLRTPCGGARVAGRRRTDPLDRVRDAEPAEARGAGARGTDERGGVPLRLGAAAVRRPVPRVLSRAGALPRASHRGRDAVAMARAQMPDGRPRHVQ